MAADRPKPYYPIINGAPRCPWSTADTIAQALEFVPGKGDLLQVSFPKSGTHWVQYITQLILNEGEPVSSYEDFMLGAFFLEYQAGVENYKASTQVRTLCTHLPLRREKLNPEAKYIYVARNPWDVCVSFYHMVTEMSVYRFENGTFDDFLEAFLTGPLGFGGYFEHVMSGYSLKDEPNVLFLTYEELQRDTRATVLRLAHFIGERYGKMLNEQSEESRKRLDLILQRSSAQSMKKLMVFDMGSHPDPDLDKWLKGLNISSKAAHGGDSKRHDFVREARAGKWQKHFSPEQLRHMETAIVEKTRGSDVMNLWSDIRREAICLSEANNYTSTLHNK